MAFSDVELLARTILCEAGGEGDTVQTKKYDQHAANPGKHCLTGMEKASYSRHSQSQKKKSKTDAHHKKQSIYHHLSPVIMNFPILASHACSTGQIADIKRKKRKHAGRKKANESLKKHCHCRYTYIKLKSHRVCIPRLSIIPYFSVYSRFCWLFPPFTT